MPRYQLSATVPAGTAEVDAVEVTQTVDERYIREGFIYAAPGSAYTVKAALRSGDKQLLPAPQSDRTVVPDVTDPAPIRFTLPGSPNKLELRVHAPNSSFEHTVKAVVDVVPREEASPLQRIANRITGGQSRVRPASNGPEP